MCCRYMAPEMIELLFPKNSGKSRCFNDKYLFIMVLNCSNIILILRHGYTYMADYWSLGVVIYVLLTGLLPYEVGSNEEIDLEAIRTQEIPFEDISESCKDLILSLLNIDPKARLGFGVNGLRQIQNHKFFTSFDWDCVASNRSEPPIIPEKMNKEFVDLSEKREPVYATFDDLPVNGDEIDSEMQDHFSNFDYISPATLRIEFGIANEKQFETKKTKLRNVLGDAIDHSSSLDSRSASRHSLVSIASKSAFSLRNIFTSNPSGRGINDSPFHKRKDVVSDRQISPKSGT